MARVRPSLQAIVQDFDNGNRAALDNLIRAFRKIQSLDPDNPDSFFTIAGYHGQPFVSEKADDDEWWGGYCQHNTVLFPTWHRAYLLRLEEALRNAMPEADIALPYWDECLTYGSNDDPIPWILVAPQFDLDGDTNNPLFSYTMQRAISDNHTTGGTHRYSRPKGYQTVRYPLSGLVGNPEDQEATAVHNQNFSDPASNANILNSNVKAWLDGTVKIKNDDGDHTRISDTFSVYSRYKISLYSPNYTVFSNKASMAQWIQEHKRPPRYGVALEEGHNAIHLAVGGFYQKNENNANEISGANGDMGENETAAFDPIFYLHHAFVDYVFWIWQRRHNTTARGSLTVDPSYDGTKSAGNPAFPKGMSLDMSSHLKPFKKANGKYYTSEDVTNIEEIEGPLAYTYAPGSFDHLVDAPASGPAYQPDSPLVTVAHIGQINRADHEGSFVICTFAELPDGTEVQIGRESVLSRWHTGACANCLNNPKEHSFIAVDEGLLKALGLGPGGGHEGGYMEDPKARLKEMLKVEIHTRLEGERGVEYTPRVRPTIEML